ncbi:hypothetical protein Hypma_011201 [Hypsizygus marmoreus]|uniref:Bromo domain-containing protein n=1 Tax=Hypsizygus marmoreus TaxID=39966 RepID=A0A369JQF6_HYPMA|nr:hypothetical protein Hypma_011201 [Hypsizygus marmoreus]
MEEVLTSFTPAYSPSESPEPSSLPKASTSRSSGLTLILPPLKGGKPVKASKKSKQRLGSQPLYGGQEEEKKVHRPVKLKPLKEVLEKLIAQIKKKDDYAFFLKPVDTSQVPGYIDVVKRPMDFGTMTVKVSRGKYRSLEEFAADLRLVTSNARAFNPPGTIYYTEADRIEAWALDHISKASSTVIQYETDWNIDIEKDEEGTPVNIDEDDDYNAATPMDIDEPGGRSPSVASQIQPGPSRRGTRGPYKKSAPSNTLSDSIDAEGRLPGSRDGLGAFPPGSDWAQTMLALKLKGKRYKTKKERLRFEKEGPPLHVDGSLDYTEMEDPFSVLSFFAPEPVSRPYLTPLHPPLFLAPSSSQPQYDPSSSISQSQASRPPTPFLASTSLPLDHKLPTIAIPAGGSGESPSTTGRRHWVVSRNPTRNKHKDRDDDNEPAELPAWQTPREIHTVDYGSFALLTGAIEDEMRRRGVSGKDGEEEGKFLAVLRDGLNCEDAAIERGLTSGANDAGRINDYWTTQRAAAGEEYIRDTVYGGVDGLAYVRSIAEFVTDRERQEPTPCPGLGGLSLAQWVERELVDSLTDGRHALLRSTAIELAMQTSRQPLANADEHADQYQRRLHTQVRNSLHTYPSATVALAALLQIKMHKIDMGSLIKTPEELFQSEEEWAGKVFRERRKACGQEGAQPEEPTRIGDTEVEEPEKTWMNVDGVKSGDGKNYEYALEGPEELKEVLDYVADVIVSLDKSIREGRNPKAAVKEGKTFDAVSSLGSDLKVDSDAEEDPVLRNLRLNLLALAKRAPLDTIARLPKDLVPEHIRHFVPTLSSTG